MSKRIMGWLGILMLLHAAPTLAATETINYTDDENRSNPIVIDGTTILTFDGANAKQSGNITGTTIFDNLEIYGGDGALWLTGSNTVYSGFVTHYNGTLVFTDNNALFAQMQTYNPRGDLAASQNQAVIAAANEYGISTDWSDIESAIGAARDEKKLPTFMVADNATVKIVDVNQRITIRSRYAGSFHLQSGAKLTFSNDPYSDYSIGGAISLYDPAYDGALLAFTADDDTAEYVFSKNRVTDTFDLTTGGGAIDNRSTKGMVILTNANFDNNGARAIVQKNAAKGGAIYNAGNLTATRTKFTNNYVQGSGSAKLYGGAIFNSEGVVTLTDAKFTENIIEDLGESGSVVEAYGGAIYSVNTGGPATVVNTATFEENYASGMTNYGGAIYTEGDLTVADTEFTGNRAGRLDGSSNTGFGGAVLTKSGNLTITDSSFIKNYAIGSNTAHGGAIAFYNDLKDLTLNVSADKTSVFMGNLVISGNIPKANSIYFSSANSFTVNTDDRAVLDMRDPMAIASTGIRAIAKTGAGTWKLGGDNVFSVFSTTTFDVNGGTLHLYGEGEADNANHLDPDAKVKAGSISLAGANHKFTLTADTTLSLGGVGHVIGVGAGEVKLADNATLAFDMTAADTAKTNLTLTAKKFDGTVGIGGVKLTNMDDLVDSASAGDVFTLVDTGKANQATDSGALYADGVPHQTGRSAKEYGLVTGDNAKKLQLKFIDATQSANLTWTGDKSANWNSSDRNWKGAIDGVRVDQFLDGDKVVFDGTGANKTVTVAPGGVEVDSMQVTDAGYQFNLTAGSTPAITAGTVDLGGATLNITGYVPAADTDFFDSPRNVQTLIDSENGVSNFNGQIKVAGQTDADAFLTAYAYQDGNDVKVATGLSWYSSDPTRKAHGTFNIDGDETFTLGAALADNSSSTNKAPGWDGKSLTKTGTGELVLDAANAYTGATDVDAGVLRLADADAVKHSDVSVSPGAVLAADQSSYVNSLSLENATLSISAGDKITASGTITLAGTNTIDIAMDRLTPGSYDILTGNDPNSVGGFDEDNFVTLINGGALSDRAHAAYSVDTLHSTVTLDLSFVNLDLTWKGGSGNWLDANWDGPSDNMFYDGDRTTFAHGSGEVTVDAAGVGVSDMLVSGGDYTFRGGDISASGAGKLVISDASATFANDIDFAGGIDVLDGGRLYADGSADMSGGVSVASGGVFGARSGATPTLDSLTMAAGSTFAVSDSVVSVRGGADISQDVEFTFGSDLSAGKTYTFLTSGGINGWSGPAEYLKGFLRYTVDSPNGADLQVLVEIYRNLIDLGLSPNQAAALSGLESWNNRDNELYNAVLTLEDDEARRALSSLTGQIHANIPAQLLQQNRGFWQFLDGPVLLLREDARRAAVAAAVTAANAHACFIPCPCRSRRPLLWFSGGVVQSRSPDEYDSARDRATSGDFRVGGEATLADWRLGLAFRFADTRLKVDDRASRADLDNYHFGLYAMRESRLGDGELRFTAGASGGYHEIGADRRVAYGTLDQRLGSNYHAWSLSGLADVGYRMNAARGLFLEPYLALGWDSVWSGSFRESGGSAALWGSAGRHGNFSAGAGMRLLYQLAERVSLNARAGWRHSFGSLRPRSDVAFIASPADGGFAINGSRLARDEFSLGAGVRVNLSDRLFVRADYSLDGGNGAFAHWGALSGGIGF